MNNLNKFGLNMNNNMPMNQNLGVVGGIGPMINNQQMNMINPQMNMNFGRNGMSFSADQIKINPMMNQMRMNQINPQMPMVNGMGPMCMNQMMGMNQMNDMMMFPNNPLMNNLNNVENFQTYNPNYKYIRLFFGDEYITNVTIFKDEKYYGLCEKLKYFLF